MKKERKSVITPMTEQDSYPNHSATTMDGRENEMINLAYNLAEKRMREGTASSQEIVHFLRLGSAKERMEQEQMEAEIALKKAKVEALKENESLEKTYNEAIEAMKKYSGN